MNYVRSLFLSFAVAVVALNAAAQGPGLAGSTEPGWENTAQLIGVLPEIMQLRKIGTDSAPADRWQILWLHQHISEKVTAASLQVDATMAQIDNEIARANEVHGYLADRRDRTVTRANLLSVIVGGGLGATSSGLQLSSTLTKPAAAVGIGAGTVSAGLAIAGIRAQKGRTEQFNFNSNMLAEFFNRPALPDSHYPATVRTFLDGVAPTGPSDQTRRQQLLQTWVQVKRIDSLGSTDKIARLTSEPTEGLMLTIDDFEDRAAMLQDVRARISLLKRDLGLLLASLPEVGEAAEAASPTAR
jgi:hypothetical protein